MESKIKFDQKNLHIVDINEVRENTWNPKKVKGKGYKEVIASIKNRGLLQPIMVRTNPNDQSTYEILDGCHRFNACKELGYSKILIYDFGEMSDEMAKSYTIYWEMGVRPDKQMFNDLLIELKDQIDLPYSVDFIENLELNETTSPSPNLDEPIVPNYCFTGLSQEDFEYISENIDMIASELGILKEKDVLIELIQRYQKGKM